MRRIIRTPDFPVAETRSGKLHGFMQDDVYHFYGIRYGRAKRFSLPEAEKPWEGIKDAKSYGYICPLLPEAMAAQSATVHDPSDEKNPMAPPFASFEMPHVYWPMDEQCLYLNIWTKHIDTQAKRPVLVWLHGGGYAAGSSMELPSYDGHNLSDYADVVVVNLNHRLNCLGFLDLSGFGEEFRYSGCLGLMDIVLALEWVRDNIAFFGGDPGNVTVAGQSGGGGKASNLLQMPPADGLYHKVISQSGSMAQRPFTSLREEKEYWQELGNKTAQILGLDRKNINRIREIPYEQLSLAAEQAGRELGREGGMMLFRPSPVEGVYKGPYDLAGFRAETADIPYMAGTVLGEFSFMHYLGDKTRYTEEEKRELLKNTFGEETDRILELFRELYPNLDPLYALSIDTLFRPAATAILDARTRFLKTINKQTKCFNYMIIPIIPYLGGITLYHCGDIPFVFRNTEAENLLCTASQILEKLEDDISNAWISFMKTGDPSTKELPFDPYSEEDKARMIFDENCYMTRKDDSEMLAAMSRRRVF